MSMSIPFLFEPVLLESEAGELCTIVDGSILSSFPVWLFDVDRAVTRADLRLPARRRPPR